MTTQRIDGQVYDTDDAEQIIRYEPIEDPEHAEYISETLYRTDDGRWFLHQSGLSRTTSAIDRGYSTEETIVPLTTREVLRWSQRRASIDSAAVTGHFDEKSQVA